MAFAVLIWLTLTALDVGLRSEFAFQVVLSLALGLLVGLWHGSGRLLKEHRRRAAVAGEVVTDRLVLRAPRSRDASAYNIDAAGGTCELGWSMAPGARYKGYSTEAITAALDTLHQRGFRQVIVGTADDNQPVRRVLEHTGAQLVRTGPHTLPDGSTVTSVWYAHM